VEDRDGLKREKGIRDSPTGTCLERRRALLLRANKRQGTRRANERGKRRRPKALEGQEVASQRRVQLSSGVVAWVSSGRGREKLSKAGIWDGLTAIVAAAFSSWWSRSRRTQRGGRCGAPFNSSIMLVVVVAVVVLVLVLVLVLRGW